jgi:catechol 2,3-dioxygenase-like lactoylglutathione lyase family enzyme
MASLDHITMSVTDLARAKAFYAKVLAPLGVSLLKEYPGRVTGTVDFVGFGKDQKPDFWLKQAGKVAPPIHIAFSANSRADVDAFYATALSAGAADNGPPGPRPIYHPGYYGAFVLDPDGHNIEAVCHKP